MPLCSNSNNGSSLFLCPPSFVAIIWRKMLVMQCSTWCCCSHYHRCHPHAHLCNHHHHHHRPIDGGERWGVFLPHSIFAFGTSCSLRRGEIQLLLLVHIIISGINGSLLMELHIIDTSFAPSIASLSLSFSLSLSLSRCRSLITPAHSLLHFH